MIFKVEVIDLMSVVRMKALFSSNPVHPKACKQVRARHVPIHANHHFILCVGTDDTRRIMGPHAEIIICTVRKILVYTFHSAPVVSWH